MVTYINTPQDETRKRLRQDKALLNLQHKTADRVKLLPARYVPKTQPTRNLVDSLISITLELSLIVLIGYGAVSCIRRVF